MVRGEDEEEVEEEPEPEEEPEIDPADFSFGGDTPSQGSPTPTPSQGTTPLLGRSGNASPSIAGSLSSSRVGSKQPSPRLENQSGTGTGSESIGSVVGVPGGKLVFTRTTSMVPEDPEDDDKVDDVHVATATATVPASASARGPDADPASPETQSEPISPQPTK